MNDCYQIKHIWYNHSLMFLLWKGIYRVIFCEELRTFYDIDITLEQLLPDSQSKRCSSWISICIRGGLAVAASECMTIYDETHLIYTDVCSRFISAFFVWGTKESSGWAGGISHALVSHWPCRLYTNCSFDTVFAPTCLKDMLYILDRKILV